MKKILEGIQRFRKEDYPRRRQFFERLASKPQNPSALFITCSDSRLLLNEITSTDPGDLFQIRNAGNIIPPHGADGGGGGESATIEYALTVLGVRNIVVCGHSQCGAIQSLLAGVSLDETPAVKHWFSHAEATRRIVRHKYSHLSGADLAVAATEENVLVQMNHLSTHPHVAARLAARELSVYGWYYDIASGSISQYEQALGRFIDITDEAIPASPLPLRSSQDETAARVAG